MAARSRQVGLGNARLTMLVLFKDAVMATDFVVAAVALVLSILWASIWIQKP